MNLDAYARTIGAINTESAMSEYTITRDPDTGLQVVRYYGVRVGQTQSEAGAKIIRRNHRRRMAAEQAEILDRRETQSDRDAWYDMDR